MKKNIILVFIGIIILSIIGLTIYFAFFNTNESNADEMPRMGPPGRMPMGMGMQSETDSATAVEVCIVEPQQINRALHLTGELIAKNIVKITPTVSGIIKYCPWNEGDNIVRGQRIVEIDDRTYQNEIELIRADLVVAMASYEELADLYRPEEIAQAQESIRQLQAEKDLAEINLQRTERLVEIGGLAASDLEIARVDLIAAETNYRSALQNLNMMLSGQRQTSLNAQRAKIMQIETQLDIALENLQECRVDSPIAGTVLSVSLRTGDYAGTSSTILEIMDRSSMVFKFSVSELYYSELYEGMNVNISLDAYPDKAFTSRVVRIYPNLDETSRNITVEAALVSGVNLVPGMFARIELILETVNDAVVIPVNSTETSVDGVETVFVVRNGKAYSQIIATGIVDDEQIQVLTGLQIGDLVIISETDNLMDGTDVQITNEDIEFISEQGTDSSEMTINFPEIPMGNMPPGEAPSSEDGYPMPPPSGLPGFGFPGQGPPGQPPFPQGNPNSSMRPPDVNNQQ